MLQKCEDVTMFFSDPDSHDDLSHDNDDRANEEMLALAPRLQVNPSDLWVGPVITKKGSHFNFAKFRFKCVFTITKRTVLPKSTSFAYTCTGSIERYG